MRMDKETRNYDPDEFDWDGSEAAVEDQLEVDRIQQLITEALGAQDSRSDVWIRPSAVHEDRARIQLNVPYVLSDSAKDYIKEQVGGVRTLTFDATSYHDHPVSHTLTEYNEDLVVRSFAGQPYVNLFGNRNRDDRYGRHNSHVVASKYVPHDWFRNRGVDSRVESVEHFHETCGFLRYKRFLTTHSLYYMTLDDVSRYLANRVDAEFCAIVHRHDQVSGYLNHGELKYEVDIHGIVTQTNVKTGFKYEHRTLEPLWHSDSAITCGGSSGLTWDIHQLCGETYLIKFVYCPPLQCSGRLVQAWDVIKKSMTHEVRNNIGITSVFGYTWYYRTLSDQVVKLEDMALFDRLRRTIAGKERTPRTKSDLMAMCRRLANKNDIISVHQGFHHEVPPERMADYVNAAFYVDVRHEVEVAIQYHRENADAVNALNKYLAEGVLPKSGMFATNVLRAAKDGVALLQRQVLEPAVRSLALQQGWGPYLDEPREISEASKVAANLTMEAALNVKVLNARSFVEPAPAPPKAKPRKPPVRKAHQAYAETVSDSSDFRNPVTVDAKSLD